MRIFSRSSLCSPFITPITTIKAVTPTATPAVAISVMSDTNRDERRLRR